MRTKRPTAAVPALLTSEKVMQTFRLPRDLLTLLKEEAARKGLDLTALVVRLLHGYMTYFGLPDAATSQLEADREALGMDRDQYVVHLLYHRSLDVRAKGPGFDSPGKERKGR